MKNKFFVGLVLCGMFQVPIKAECTVNPCVITYTPDHHYSYMLTAQSQNVFVYNNKNNLLSHTTITVGTNPVDIVMAPSGLVAYVANSGSNSISIIDISTRTVAATIALSGSPQAIAVTPDGLFGYVVIPADSQLIILNLSSNTVWGTISCGGVNPQDIVINLSGTYAYVVNKGSATVTMIDLETNSVVGDPISVDSTPDKIALSSHGKYVVVGYEGANKISNIDTVTLGVETFENISPGQIHLIFCRNIAGGG